MTFIAKQMSRKRSPTPVIGGRWSRWARSMSGRHQQVVSKHRFAVMTLLRRTVPIYFSSHRWELKAWSLFPRINLAIDVRPQSFIFKTSLLSRTAKAQRAQRVDHREVTRLVEKSLAVENARSNNNRKASAGMEPEVVTPSVLTVSDVSRGRALDRVFRRLMIQEHETRTSGIIRKEALNIVHRVIEERRRVEERRQMPTVLRQQRPASLSQEQMNELTGRSTNQATALDRFGGNMRSAEAMPPPAMPNINLQQLTDHVIRQIDDRIIAHKERMGKLY